jgi:hypothetical protein
MSFVNFRTANIHRDYFLLNQDNIDILKYAKIVLSIFPHKNIYLLISQ